MEIGAIILWVIFIAAVIYMMWKHFNIFLIIVVGLILLFPVYGCYSEYFHDNYDNLKSKAASNSIVSSIIYYPGTVLFGDPNYVNVSGLKPLSEKDLFTSVDIEWIIIKKGFHSIGDRTANLLERLVGWKTLGGNLSCTYLPRYILIGFFASLWLFLGYFFTLRRFGFSYLEIFDNWIGRGMAYTPQSLQNARVYSRWKNMPERKPQDLWFIKMGSWKTSVLIFLGYAYIMSFVPLLNQVIRVITLEIFQPNWFIQSLIIFFEIGLLPTIITEGVLAYKKRKAYDKRIKAQTYKKIAETTFDLK